MKITRLDPSTRQPTADSWTLSRDRRQLVLGRADTSDVLLSSSSSLALSRESAC